MNSKIVLLILAVVAAISLTYPVDAFEETFQWYPDGVFTSNWVGGGSIIDAGTYNRQHSQSASIGGAPYSSSNYVQSKYVFDSNYIAFKMVTCSGSASTGNDAAYGQVILYDTDGVAILTYTICSRSTATANSNFEFLRDIGTSQVQLKINSVSQGNVGTSSKNIGYIKFYTYAYMYWVTSSASVTLTVDDITTTGYISGIGVETPYHSQNELNLKPMSSSFLMKTIPQADFDSSYFDIIWQKAASNGTLQTLYSTRVKNVSESVYSGVKYLNRYNNLTANDTNYGLYFERLTKNDVIQSSDYFFLVPAGTTNTITSDATATIGQQEIISYSIGAPDFAGSSYTINVYSYNALVVSLPIATGAATGTVTWDTAGNSAGLYFITLSKTTSGIQTDLAYTITTLVSTLLIRGTVYDAVNATPLSGVNINFSQGTTWYNTTSNGNGSYNLSGLTVALLTRINASKSTWMHNNYSFTPLAPQMYTINLYLISTGFNCSIAAGGGNSTNTCINGMVENNPYHQAVGGAAVFLGNGSYFANTTSNTTTGYYQFLNLSDDNLTYVVNATKSGFMNSQDYNVTTINQTDVQQIILMSEIYTLTIQAQDASNTNTLLDFLLLFNLANYNTTVGQITISNLVYGQYPAIVSATDYISSSQTILMDSTKTVTFLLTPISAAQASTIFKTLPHDVAFIVQDLAFNKKSGVSVTAQGYNTTVGSWTWLADLIGIDFDLIPINNMSMIGITGTDGSIDFKMDGSIYYILTFSGGNISNTTWRGYPTKYEYYIIVPTTLYGTFTNNVDQFSTMITTVSSKTINSTHAYINASHNDSMNQTSSIIIYLNKSIVGDPNNQTNLQIKNGGTNATYNASFIVSPYAGNDYIINFNMIHSSGTVIRSYGVSFPQTAILSYFNPISILMLLIGLIIFFSGIFGQTSTEQGAGIIVGLVWLLSGMGLYVNLNLGVSFYLGLTLATVIAILMNMNARARKEGMS